MSPIGLCSVSPSERHADALKVPVVLSEPAHYIKAEHLFAEICHPSARANSSGKTTERAELAGNRPTYVSPDTPPTFRRRLQLAHRLSCSTEDCEERRR